jgi:hypothetical protein
MRRMVTVLTMAAGLAVVAVPVVAQVGQEVRERPAFQSRMQYPSTLLLEKRAELGLTAEQVRQIEAIQERVRAENAPRLEQMRAARGDRPDRPVRGMRDLSATERQQLREQMRDRAETLRPIQQQVRETNRAAGEEIHALLTEAQRAQLLELRHERRAEFRRGARGGGWDGEGRRPSRGPRGGAGF